MTAPLNPVLWATLKVQQEGFSFAVISKTNATSAQNSRLILPVGVNQIQVDWLGQSKVLIQAGVSAALQKIEIPAATSGTRRTVFLRVPVDATDAYVNVTTYTNATAEVGQVMGGIQVIPSTFL